MHKHVKAQKITGTGGSDKTMVAGVLLRGGKAVPMSLVAAKSKRSSLTVKTDVEPGVAASNPLCVAAAESDWCGGS